MSSSNEKLKNALDRIPYGLLLAAWLGYLGYDYWSFTTDASSDLNAKVAVNQSARNGNETTRRKIKEANDFFKSLDKKRTELRGLAAQLEETKNALTEHLDVAAFMKTVVTEATRTGLKVRSVKPLEPIKSEYYVEQAFDLTFTGVYTQFMVFLDRISSLERIARVDSFEVKRSGSSNAPFVELAGKIQVKSYRYLGSKADEIVKSGAAAKPASQPAGDSQ